VIGENLNSSHLELGPSVVDKRLFTKLISWRKGQPRDFSVAAVARVRYHCSVQLKQESSSKEKNHYEIESTLSSSDVRAWL
jgi:hypothetical protein